MKKLLTNEKHPYNHYIGNRVGYGWLKRGWG
jgi:hypothetical protein